MNKHRLGNTDNHTLERRGRAPEALQRVEVITGVGRQRRWMPEAKVGIVRESWQPGAVVPEVARKASVRRFRSDETLTMDISSLSD